MHNNIMVAGLRDRLPMLAMGRYAQWQSYFMRYVDTSPYSEALKKCILQGPYKLSHIIIPSQLGIDESPEVPKQTAVETFMNITPENKAHYDVEKEAIHLILTGIGDKIYSTVDACKTAHDKGYNKFLQQLQPEWSRFMTNVKQTINLDKESYHKLFEILEQYQKQVNEIRAEKIAKNANLLALVVAAQQYSDTYYQAPKPHRSYAPSSKQSSSTRYHTTTRHKGKEIAKPITPPSESASEEDSDPEQSSKR
ncbi:hypothetical protein Tco_0919778 [Tanacetum coccineum]